MNNKLNEKEIELFEKAYSDIIDPSPAICRKNLIKIELNWNKKDVEKFCEWAKKLSIERSIELCPALAYSEIPEFTSLLEYYADQDNLKLMESSFETLKKDIPESIKLKICFNLLKSDKAKVRAKTCEILGKSGSLRPRQELLNCFKDESSEVIIESLNSIQKLNFKNITDELTVLFYHKDAFVRKKVIETIVFISNSKEFPEKKLKKLLLKDKNINVRVAAAWSFGKFPSVTMINTLINALLKDNSVEVKTTVAQTLGQFSSSEVIDNLMYVMKKNNSIAFSIACRESLIKINPHAVLQRSKKFFKNKDVNIRFEAVNILSKISIDGCSEILIDILKKEKNSIIISAIIEVIGYQGKCNDELWTELFELVLTSEFEVSYSLILTLSEFLNSKNIFKFISLLSEVKDKILKEIILYKISIYALSNNIPEDSFLHIIPNIEFYSGIISTLAVKNISFINNIDVIPVLMEKLEGNIIDILENSIIETILSIAKSSLLNIILIDNKKHILAFRKILNYKKDLGTESVDIIRTVVDIVKNNKKYGYNVLLDVIIIAPEIFNTYFKNYTNECIDIINGIVSILPENIFHKIPNILLAMLSSPDIQLGITAINKIDHKSKDYLISKVVDISLTEKNEELKNLAKNKIIEIFKELENEK